MKVKIFVFIFALMSFAVITKAQPYWNAVGARFGFYNGLTYKHFMDTHNALEGIISTHNEGFFVCGMYEVERYIARSNGLYGFFGIGAHVSMWKKTGESKYKPVPGVDFIGGLEYKFRSIPLAFSLDYKPAYNFGNYDPWYDAWAISLKYSF